MFRLIAKRNGNHRTSMFSNKPNVHNSPLSTKLAPSGPSSLNLLRGGRAACLASSLSLSSSTTPMTLSSSNHLLLSESRRGFRATPALRAPSSDYYSVLGVSPTASAEEIKASYKRLALQYHPDRNSSPGAEEKFKEISEAYSVVGHKDKRAQYDASRQFGGGYSSGGSGGSGGGPYSSYSGGRQRPSYQSGGQTYAGAYPRSGGFQTMSKEDADKLFREIFGGMNVEQMIKDMERNRTGGGGTSFSASRSNNAGMGMGNPFADMMGGMMGGGAGPAGGSGGQQTYRPNFYSEREEVKTDGFGNTTVKREFRDANGNVYNVYSTTSADPNASMNQSETEVNEKYRDPSTGRFKFSNASTSTSEGAGEWGDRYQQGVNNPFSRVFNYNRSVVGGMNPAARMYVLLFTTLVLAMLLGLLSFFLSHPGLWLLCFLLYVLRRRF